MIAEVHWSDYEIEGDGKEVLGAKERTSIGRVREETLVASNGVLGAIGVVGVAVVVVAGWFGRGGGGRFVSGLRLR